MAWLVLFVAGLFEIGWAVGLKFTDGFSKPIPIALTAVSLVMSMYLAGYGTGNGLIESYDSTYSTFISVGLSLVSFIIFLVCYRGVLARFESGELKPVVRPQIYGPMPYPPYPPQYMPPPPAQPQG